MYQNSIYEPHVGVFGLLQGAMDRTGIKCWGKWRAVYLWLAFCPLCCCSQYQKHLSLHPCSCLSQVQADMNP